MAHRLNTQRHWQQRKLYLKASDETRAHYEAAGCQRFIYEAIGVEKSVNYYTAPDEAMESPDAMLPWERLAFSCGLTAKVRAKPRANTKTKPKSKPKPKPTKT